MDLQSMLDKHFGENGDWWKTWESIQNTIKGLKNWATNGFESTYTLDGPPNPTLTPAPTEAPAPKPTFLSPQPTQTPMPQAPTPSPTQPPNMAPLQPAMPTPTPAPKQNRSAELQQQSPVTDAFVKDIVVPILAQYGIPAAVGAGQFGAEGRLGGRWAEQNNFYNVGGYDQNPQPASYPTEQAGVEGYAKLLTEDPRYKDIVAQYSNDPVTLLKLIAPIYASRPDYANFIMDTPEWKQYYNGGQ